MAGATLTTMDAALKETWTDDALVSQLFNENRFLGRVDRLQKTPVGQQALTPIVTNRNGGYQAFPNAGNASLNPAANVEIKQAAWNLKHNAVQVKIEKAAIEGTSGDAVSVADVIDTEVQGAVDELRKQLSRESLSNGDALIAKCKAGGASTTVNLETVANGGRGYDAILRGHLHVGMTVDIGTTASEATIVGDTLISAVAESPTAPTITIGSSVTTTTSHYVSFANNRSGTTSYEMNGLRNIAGSASSVLGGIDPASVPSWAPAAVDTSSTTFSLADLYGKQRSVYQKTGEDPDWIVTSPFQAAAIYDLLQAQVRFAGDIGLGAGNYRGVKVGTSELVVDPDCYSQDVFFVTSKNLMLVESRKPHWQSDITGGKRLEWTQGGTSFVGAIFYHADLATRRRNSHAAFTGLTGQSTA